MTDHLLNRRTFTATLASGTLAATAIAAAPTSGDTVGPMVGHVSETTAKVWYRPAAPGKYRLQIREAQGEGKSQSIDAEATLDNDLCLTWQVENLKPATRYQYAIEGAAASPDECYLITAPPADRREQTCLAFGSCADMKPSSLWSQMEERGAQGLVLLGDTPYIDSTKLETARTKQRTFLQVPELAALIRHTPVWATWDDHDFAGNDTDGRVPGKENTRRAFVEYHANEAFGHDDEGIYTKFRYGGMEVFLLDTRWFSRTEPSPVDPEKPTLLGKRQWEWLKEGLASSTAPFKVIACGMIWDDKENTESDDWGTYTYERDALFDFIGQQRITGVVLIGGDIHCSRLLRYKTTGQAGYPIHQFIVSPIHDRTIPSLNVAHPDLIKGAAIPHVWLRLEADMTRTPATLHAEWVQRDDRKMWDLKLDETQLRPA
ncbi:alkaline phosphatase family protein [Blastopirellula sp. JC732]|uniref:Alkaline phosphatase family protein n=1 Tax=Blastopirellula sediminis TaxID=2894196 RepID=A0A9X1MK35_9BACT|nr:alkaline phosphatase D family protein [Blastopirellula sediminis]MCC9608984.1 alkaline phosphatase family protein [Blastopirellula sediminis]MCC9628239.1 alkaline phosphatase family protein [Blastopirellula sediminis]